jgi:hypothetical protein
MASRPPVLPWLLQEALWEVGALPLLASLLRQGADARTGSLHAVQAAVAPPQAAGGEGSSSEGAKQGPTLNAQSSLNAAAVYAVGALVNLVLHVKCAAELQKVGVVWHSTGGSLSVFIRGAACDSMNYLASCPRTPLHCCSTHSVCAPVC